MRLGGGEGGGGGGVFGDDLVELGAGGVVGEAGFQAEDGRLEETEAAPSGGYCDGQGEEGGGGHRNRAGEMVRAEPEADGDEGERGDDGVKEVEAVAVAAEEAEHGGGAEAMGAGLGKDCADEKGGEEEGEEGGRPDHDGGVVGDGKTGVADVEGGEGEGGDEKDGAAEAKEKRIGAGAEAYREEGPGEKAVQAGGRPAIEDVGVDGGVGAVPEQEPEGKRGKGAGEGGEGDVFRLAEKKKEQGPDEVELLFDGKGPKLVDVDPPGIGDFPDAA